MRGLLFIVAILYTVLLITRPHEFLPGLAESSLLQVILLTAAGMWACTSDRGTELPQFRALPLFLLCVWLSLGAAGWWGGIVPAAEKLLPPILLFVILTGCVRSVRDLKIYSTVVIACACILVFHGHLQATTGIGWTGQPMIQGRITYSGIFNDPNDMGLLIVLSIALTVYHLRAQSSRLVRLAMWSALGWLLYGVYLTDSRGTMLATLVVLGLEVWRSYGKAVVVALGAVAVTVLLAFTRLAELDAEEASAGNRVDAWYEGMQMLTANPLFGVGWGMFSDHHGLTAHNSWVLAMAELGLVGYTVWFSFVAITAWVIFRLAFPAGPQGSPRPAGVDTPAPTAPEPAATGADEQAERLAARSLLFALSGFAVGAFFLSQSYKAMLFINCGLVVGRWLGMRARGLPVPAVSLAGALPRMCTLAVASIVGLWILVRILL